MATAITILNHELAPLITRVYKHSDHEDAPLDEIFENFRLVLVNNNINSLEPVIQVQNYHYIYIYSNNLIMLIVVAGRYYQLANIMCYLVFLKKFEQILKNYFKTPVLDQDLIIDNFLLLYELFDEMMDFGFVQITDYNILNEYIKMKLNVSSSAGETDQEDSKKSKPKDKSKEEFLYELNSSISRISTTQLSWRPKGIFYKKNEIFIDIVEKVNLLVDLKSHIKKQLISGDVKVKCFLSGMPNLRLGLNEFLVQDNDESSMIDSFKRIKFDNLNFHQCVELSKFSSDNTISFIPPDGKFVLLTYKLQAHKQPLIKISNINFKKKIVYKVKRRQSQSAGAGISISSLNSNIQSQIVSLSPLQKRASTAPQLPTIPPPTSSSSPALQRRTSVAPSIASEDGSASISAASAVGVDDNVVKETKLLISLDMQTNFTKRLAASEVSIVIPISFKKYHVNFDQVPRFKTKVGVVVLDLEKECIIWKISHVSGAREFQMSSEISLLNDEDIAAFSEKSEILSGDDDENGGKHHNGNDSNDDSDSDSDSEAEKTYNYYYGNRQDKAISDKAKRLQKIYKEVRKEKRKIYGSNSKGKKPTLIKSDLPTSPSLLMENDKSIQENINTIVDSPSILDQPVDIHDEFYVNKNMVKVSFKIENLTHSGLKVTFLKINEPQLEYTSFPWVKYMSTNDDEYCFKFDFNRKGPSETIVKRVKEREKVELTKFIGGGNKRAWKKL